MRRACISVALVVSVALCATPAQGKTIKSEVSIDGFGAGAGTVTVRGQVDSKRAACLRARKSRFLG